MGTFHAVGDIIQTNHYQGDKIVFPQVGGLAESRSDRMRDER